MSEKCPSSAATATTRATTMTNACKSHDSLALQLGTLLRDFRALAIDALAYISTPVVKMHSDASGCIDQ
jgi:hypothetical protein